MTDEPAIPGDRARDTASTTSGPGRPVPASPGAGAGADPDDPRLRLLLPRPRSARRPAGSWAVGGRVVVTAPRAGGGEDGGGAGSEAGVVIATAVERVRAALARHGVTVVGGVGGDGATVRLRIDPRPAGEAGGAVDAAGIGAPPRPSAESYRLSVGPAGVDLVAADAAGLLHGTATLDQWLHLAAEPGGPDSGAGAGSGRGAALTVPALEVRDRPDFRHRGVMLDLSRDKVPRMGTLRQLVAWLSGLKVNQLQLYCEHTFAYRGHETVWRDASPLTPDDVAELDALCRAHAIELVPNQNSLGHFHRWLTHPEYRPLAECPDGVAHPWAHPETGGPEGDREPFSLCATDPRSLDLLADLYAQLLPCFSSGRLNAGLDETFDLGRCRSQEEVEGRGKHAVYLEYLRSVRDLAAGHGKALQFWGDVLLEAPELATEVPDDAVALLWGHEPGHPFAENGAVLAEAGRAFYVCPGSSAWTSFGGRLDVAVANAAEAGAQGRDAGAEGYLQTDWGDFGHLQPLPVSFPGLLAGAAAAWNADRPLGMEEVAAAVAVHALGGEAGEGEGGGEHDTGGVGAGDETGGDGPAARLARALTALGTVHTLAGGSNRNGTALFYLLLKPGRAMDSKRFEGLTAESLEAARGKIARAVSLLDAEGSPTLADPGADDGLAEQARGAPADQAGDGGREATTPPLGDLDAACRELRWVARMLDLACRLGLARLAAGAKAGDPAAPLSAVPAAVRTSFAADLDALFTERRRLWLARNRPGGLDHAFGFFAPLAERLRHPGDPT